MCGDEFRLRNFKFWHPFQRDFAESRWLSLPVFVTYRVIVTAYNLGWLFYNIYLFRAKLFIYLTNWTFLILNIYFVYATTLSCIALYKDKKKRNEALPKASGQDGPDEYIQIGTGDDSDRTDAREVDNLRLHHKVLWVIYVISATGGVWITAGYWTVLFEDDPVDANNITKHALNSVFMVIDTSLSSIPIRLFHWVYALLYFAVYILFSVFYWLAGGTNNGGKPYIYSALNYDDFKKTTAILLVVFLLVVLPILHLILFSLTKLRDYLYKKFVT